MKVKVSIDVIVTAVNVKHVMEHRSFEADVPGWYDVPWGEIVLPLVKDAIYTTEKKIAEAEKLEAGA